MANLVQTLIPILFLLAATARSQPSSTSFFYDFVDPAHSTGLTFQGDTQLIPGSSFLRLTGATNTSVGRVLYSNPVQFSQTGGQVDFETNFSFRITPNTSLPPADGLVFFIAPVGTALPFGAGGGNFGVFDAIGNGPAVFAVEFDTFVNGWDPNDLHIGIDLGSWESNKTTNVGDAIVGQQVNVTITYAGATGAITVVATAGSQTFEVSFDYDLSTFLPRQVQVGLAASTGELVAKHDVFWWYFECTMVEAASPVPVPAPALAAKKIRPFL